MKKGRKSLDEVVSKNRKMFISDIRRIWTFCMIPDLNVFHKIFTHFVKICGGEKAELASLQTVKTWFSEKNFLEEFPRVPKNELFANALLEALNHFSTWAHLFYYESEFNRAQECFTYTNDEVYAKTRMLNLLGFENIKLEIKIPDSVHGVCDVDHLCDLLRSAKDSAKSYNEPVLVTVDNRVSNGGVSLRSIRRSRVTENDLVRGLLIIQPSGQAEAIPREIILALSNPLERFHRV
jgi:hypothetical protein